MAISADGQSVVFSTSAAVRTSAALVPTGGRHKSGGNSAIYVHDPVSGATTQLSDPSNSSFAPSVSADGRLVSYYSAAAQAIDVVNRLATGSGVLDGPGNLVQRQVTGTVADLPHERVRPCAGEASGPAWVPCGPVLSADGDSLAYPVTQDAVSPSLLVGVSFNGSAASAPVGNVIDFTPSNGGQGYGFGPTQTSTTATITYTNEDMLPVAMRGVQLDQPGGSAAAEPFTLGPTTCTAVLAAQARCSAQATFDPGHCPSTDTAPALVTGELTTAALTSVGQSAITLSAVCDPSYGPGASVPPLPTCPATPPGLDLVPAPSTQADNQGTTIEDTGPDEIGRPYVTWQVITPVPQQSVAVAFLPANRSDCGLQLVDPASLDLADPLPATAPPACTQGQVFSAPPLGSPPTSTPSSCTAYVLVHPQAVALDAALLGVIYEPHIRTPLSGAVKLKPTAIVSSRGIHSLIVVRHDSSGTGQFAGAPTIVENVDSSGTLLPGASQPALSANGRYLSFAAPVPFGSPGQQAMIGSTQVWRHDTDLGGNAKDVPGPTVLVSCLPAGQEQPCQSPPDAQSPSMSADGNWITFASLQPQQVYLRDIPAASTQLISSSDIADGVGADGPSWAPALSADASAIVFASAATDLAAPATQSGADNLYTRQLSTSAPPQLITQSSLPAGSGMLAPTIDMHGRLITFATDSALLPFASGRGAGNGVSVLSGYLLERHPDLATTPATLNIDAALLDTSTPMTFRVTNRGPGPATVTAVSTAGSVNIVAEDCDRIVLLPGATCTITASFTAVASGTQLGAVVVTSADDGEPAQTFTCALSATVLAPKLFTSPDVAGPGEVTQVTGVSFPPDTTVTLTWSPGLGSTSVRTDRAGTLHASLVIFPDDAQGPRFLDASAMHRPRLASAPFLVEADWLPLRPP